MSTRHVHTHNDFLVNFSPIPNGITILRFVPTYVSKEQALRLAAWIVALLDDDEEFARTLVAVRNTSTFNTTRQEAP